VIGASSAVGTLKRNRGASGNNEGNIRKAATVTFGNTPRSAAKTAHAAMNNIIPFLGTQQEEMSGANYDAEIINVDDIETTEASSPSPCTEAPSSDATSHGTPSYDATSYAATLNNDTSLTSNSSSALSEQNVS